MEWNGARSQEWSELCLGARALSPSRKQHTWPYEELRGHPALQCQGGILPISIGKWKILFRGVVSSFKCGNKYLLSFFGL